jgi:hypothetical protein
LRLWHLASLDAPTVAAVWSLAFAKAAGVRLPIWVPILLALMTWTVYIGDRLLDARSALCGRQAQGLRERHLFHWRHRRAFLSVGIAASCVSGWIVLSWMPAMALQRNTVLAGAAMAYFSCVHAPIKTRLPISKELAVGVLFTAGCAIPTLGRAAHLSAGFIAAFAFFAGLAWLNCHAIESWESATEGSASSDIFFLSCVLALCGLIGASALYASQFGMADLIAAGGASALLLAMLDYSRGRLTPLALRVAADLILLTPLVMILR